MYVAFEGVDTCGKTTQIDLLKTVCPHYIFTKEPGGTNIGQTIRSIVLHHAGLDERTRFLLFSADRSEHIERIIKPNSGKIVISDRSIVSGIAYALSGSLDEETLYRLSLFATNNVLPEHVFLFQLDETTLHARLSRKEHDEVEKSGAATLFMIQNRMPTICEKLGISYTIIDATLPIETIHEYIKGALQ